MFSRHRRKVRFLLALSDVFLIVLAFEAAYRTRLLLQLEHAFYLATPVKILLVGYGLIIWVGAGLWLDVYDRLESAPVFRVLRETLRQCLVGGVAVVLFQYFLRLDLSRSFMALFTLYTLLLQSLYRLLAASLTGVLRRGFSSPQHVMVVGLGERARRLGETLEQSAHFGIKLTGFLADGAAGAPAQVTLDKVYPVYPLDQLPELLRSRVIDEILVSVDGEGLPGVEDAFLLCDEEGVRIRLAVDFFPHVNSEVYLEKLGPFPLLTFTATPHDEILLLAKRSTDVLLSALGLVLLMPVLGLVVLLVRLTSPGPAIFRQIRCGLNGRRFTMYKFRSMCDNAEQLKAGLEHLNARQTVFKIPKDPRLTPLGRWLRKFSIDEWPQLWNVLKGDMSLVGPRPAVPEEVEQYKRWQRRSLRMRPGLTCLWALAGRDALDFETWMRLDMQYIDNWSLTLDWKILLGTLPRVLIGKGAH